MLNWDDYHTEENAATAPPPPPVQKAIEPVAAAEPAPTPAVEEAKAALDRMHQEYLRHAHPEKKEKRKKAVSYKIFENG